MVRLLHRWVGRAVGCGGPAVGDQAEARPPARRGVIRPSPRPSSTSVVEDLPVCGRRRGCRRRRRPGAAASRAATQVCRRCARRAAGARRAGGRRRRRPGRPRRAPRAAAAPGEHAGGDRVVDALAGHRVDQPGRVAGQQHRAVGLVASASPRAAGGGPASASPAAGRAGQQPLELLEQQRAGSARVGPSPAAARRTRRWRGRRRGRRPRRTTAGGGRRTGSPGARASAGVRGRVAADAPAPGGPARPPAGAARTHGVRAVGADHDAGAVVPSSSTTRPSARVSRADPVAAQHGAGGDRPLDQPGVEDLARGTTQAGRAIVPADRVPAAGAARGGAAASSRRPRRRRRPPRSASTTCGAMPSPQDLSRGKSARSSSSTRSDGSAASAPSAVAAPAGPGADDDEVPVGPSRRSRGAPPPAARRRPARCAIAAAERRLPPRPGERASREPAPAPTTSAAPRGTAGAPGGPARPRRPATSSDRGQRRRVPRGAQPVRQPADAGGGVVGQVGQHVDEVGADAEQAPPATTSHAGAGRGPRPASHEDGQRRRTRRRTAATTRPST